MPLVIKISPDEEDETIKQMVDSILINQFAGVITTNTTSSRIGVSHLPDGQESGGLSGKPLFIKSTATLTLLKQLVGDSITLIGSGGIDTLKSAHEKIAAGADLIQLYTGLIYQGPNLISHLAENLKNDY